MKSLLSTEEELNTTLVSKDINFDEFEAYKEKVKPYSETMKDMLD